MIDLGSVVGKVIVVVEYFFIIGVNEITQVFSSEMALIIKTQNTL